MLTDLLKNIVFLLVCTQQPTTQQNMYLWNALDAWERQLPNSFKFSTSLSNFQHPHTENLSQKYQMYKTVKFPP